MTGEHQQKQILSDPCRSTSMQLTHCCAWKWLVVRAILVDASNLLAMGLQACLVLAVTTSGSYLPIKGNKCTASSSHVDLQQRDPVRRIIDCSQSILQASFTTSAIYHRSFEADWQCIPGLEAW